MTGPWSLPAARADVQDDPPAPTGDDADTSKTGTNVMLAGIVFQLVSMLAFSGIALHFYSRARATLLGRQPFSHDFNALAGVDALAARPVRILVWSLALASLAIIVRGAYRTVELAQGWHGYTMAHEAFFDIFDVSALARCLTGIVVGNCANCLVSWIQAVPMVFCMALLALAHPYFGLPNHGKPVNAGARAFADDEAALKAGSTGPAGSKH